jgi:hypothetical protein
VHIGHGQAMGAEATDPPLTTSQQDVGLKFAALTDRMDATAVQVQALQAAHGERIGHAQDIGAEDVEQQITTIQHGVNGKLAALEQRLSDIAREHNHFQRVVGQVFVLPEEFVVAPHLDEAVGFWKKLRDDEVPQQDGSNAGRIKFLEEGLATAEQAVRTAQTLGACQATDILQMRATIDARL